MTNEQVAFAFIRELQKRFGKTAVLSDIEMSQEQGWTHAVVDVCDAYQAAHAAVEPTCCTDCMGKPGQDGKIFHKPGCSVEWVARERAMQELAGLNENGLPDGSLQVNRPAEPT
jgi:hypothetical protein